MNCHNIYFPAEVRKNSYVRTLLSGTKKDKIESQNFCHSFNSPLKLIKIRNQLSLSCITSPLSILMCIQNFNKIQYLVRLNTYSDFPYFRSFGISVASVNEK